MYSSEVHHSSFNRPSGVGPNEEPLQNEVILSDPGVLAADLEQGNREGSFFGHTLSQVITHPTTRLAYRDSNRGAVAFGLLGALGGIPFGAALVGVTAGSNLGAPLGAAFRVVREGMGMRALGDSEHNTVEGAAETISDSLPSEEAIEEDIGDATLSSAAPKSSLQAREPDPFLGHFIEVVDYAGHCASVASIATAVVVTVVSLSAGNPLPAASHLAGVCSGGAWAFGLVTGASHWLLSESARQPALSSKVE